MLFTVTYFSLLLSTALVGTWSIRVQKPYINRYIWMHTYTRSYLIFHCNISYINIFAFILKTDSCQGSALEHEDLRNCGINCPFIQWIDIKMVWGEAEFLQFQLPVLDLWGRKEMLLSSPSYRTGNLMYRSSIVCENLPLNNFKSWRQYVSRIRYSQVQWK